MLLIRTALGVALALSFTWSLRGEVAPSEGDCAINLIFGPFATGGYLGATGFAFDAKHGAPVRKVELLLDGRPAGEVSLRGLRPDVLAHFGREDLLWSGWNGTASLDGVGAGVHAVEIVATSHSGKTIGCGRRTFVVIPAAELPARPPPGIAGEILLSTVLFVAWLGLVGWAPAVALGGPGAGASAPLFGLALFGVFAEAGNALHVQPFRAALALTILSVAAAAVALLRRRARLRRPSRRALATAGFTALFALIGVVPFAAHGEGAVLGDIDDATRECLLADSISRYGWRLPADVTGYFSAMRNEMEKRHLRRGGAYLLSALSDAFGVRSHAVHSVAMLSSGCLVVWGAGFLARVVAKRRRSRWWIAPALVALNSILVATLYGQHLGSLFGAALLLPFLAFSFRAAGRPDLRAAAPLGLLLAAALVFYPEALPVWAVAVPLAIATASGGRRLRRAAATFGLALLLTAVLTPTGLARFVRYARSEASRFATASDRMRTGDTHYFPSPTVIFGLEAYREDAPAPLGAVRRILVPVTALAILAAALTGWLRFSRRERAVILMLVVPVAAALVANLRLAFPYGYAKFLPMAAAVWSVALVTLLSAALDRRGRGRRAVARWAVSWAALALTFALALPSVRHVVRRAVRSVPAFDPDYRVLPALGRAVGRDATVVIEEPARASREWIRYFLGENAVHELGTLPAAGPSRTYLLVDRRRDARRVSSTGSVATRIFALVPFQAARKAGP